MTFDPAKPSPPPAPPLPSGGREHSGGGRNRRRTRGEGSDSDALAILDRCSGWLIYFLIIFTPWAFGTTQVWSVWVANIACYSLGLLVLAKRWRRRVSKGIGLQPRDTDPWARCFLVCVWAFLGVVLVSILNARADFDAKSKTLQYFDEQVRWLPTSYHRSSTLWFFAQYLGLALGFIAVLDWLRDDPRAENTGSTGSGYASPVPGGMDQRIPPRIRRLLWLLCLNSGLLASVGFLQRADNTSDLLWILKSRSGKSPDSVFGPWSYRSNAAQYFNIVWPVCLGLWLWVQELAYRSADLRKARFDGPQLLLVPVFVLIASAPVVSGSRGSALIGGFAFCVAVLLVLLGSQSEIRRKLRTGAALLLFLGAFVAAAVGGAALIERLGRKVISVPLDGAPSGGDAFSLVARIHVPAKPLPRYSTVVNMAPSSGDWYPAPGFLLAGLDPNGALVLMAHDAASPRADVAHFPGFLERFSGRKVDLAIIRGERLRVLADGVELAPSDPKSVAAILKCRLQNRFLEVTHPLLEEAVWVGAEIPLAEVQGLASAPLGKALERWRDQLVRRAIARQIDPLPGSLGVAVEEQQSGGFRLQRVSKTGPLGMRWSLGEPLPYRVDRVRVRAALRELSGKDWLLGFSADPGPQRAEVFGADVQESAVLALPVAPGSLPKAIDVVALAGDGSERAEVDEADGLTFQELSLQPDGGLFHWKDEPPPLFIRGPDSSGRAEIYANARRMAQDYPLWGIGFGAFQTIYELYRKPHELPAAYVHDDWLETRVCGGWISFGLVVIATGSLVFRVAACRATAVPRSTLWLISLGMVTVLVNAAIDLPFRVYSVQWLAAVLVAVLFRLSTGEVRIPRRLGNTKPIA